jgi:malate dehydrogenase (oxaloacetate-decarboxylating)
VVRTEYENVTGRLGKLTSAIGRAGGDISAVDLISSAGGRIRRDITITVDDDARLTKVLQAIKALPWVLSATVSDRVLLAHRGGKIEIVSKVPINNRDDLARIYTPGVARVCETIREDPTRVFSLTIKRNCVAIVTDGSAVLGLGNLGPLAAIPVMEGKAALYKEFAGVNAFPICLNTQDPSEIVETVERIAPVFGAINLEDIAAPRCFEVEEKLRARLDIPVLHDDQHGTAVVVVAATINALKVIGKDLRQVRVVISGAGAAGVGCAKLLLRAGVRHLVVADRRGILHAGREGLEPSKQWLVLHTNREGLKGPISKALVGADIFLGLSSPGAVTVPALRRMAKDAIIFALANPVPEVMPEEVESFARIVATGRSDYANQINNVLGFPGIMRGLLEARATEVTPSMLLAAARGLAHTIKPTELNEEYIVPSVFDRHIVPAISRAVVQEAERSGVARRTPGVIRF